MSMFDGIATGRYVLESLGFTNVTYYAYEIDEPAIQVAIKNYPDIIQMGDAFDLHSDDWKLKEAAIRPDISAETKEPQKETPAKKDRSATKTPAFIAAA